MAFQEGNCKWTFAALQDNVLGQGAQNAIIAHFNKSPYTSLIREAIQNSLDVPANSDIPVKLKFPFHVSKHQNILTFLSCASTSRVSRNPFRIIKKL